MCSSQPAIRGGTQKFPELLKKYLKYLYKSETLAPFEVLPLRLDAVILASLPVLETLSKIFNGNAAKGRQRFHPNYTQNFRTNLTEIRV
jgi:hypothetical protein